MWNDDPLSLKKTSNQSAEVRRVPGPGFLFAFDVRRRGPDALADAARKYGDVLRFRVGPRVVYLLNSAEHARHIFLDNARNYRKSPGNRKLRAFLGEGLLTSEGEAWRRHRSIVLPSFQKKAVAHIVKVAEQQTEEMLQRWSRFADTGEVFDLHAEMRGLTFRTVGYSVCSGDLHNHFQRVHDAFRVAFTHTVRRVHSLIDIPLAIPTPRNLRFRRAVHTLDQFAYEMIARRRRGEGNCEDLLAGLMAGDGDAGQLGLTDRELRDELLTLILGGYDTVSTSLSWSLYLLSQHPAVAERVRRERSDQASYARMVFSEALRLVPPVWILARQAVAEDVIGGYPITAGSIALVSPTLLHRDERYWEKPDQFLPERFEPALSAGRPPCAFIPFSAGQRQCIGMNMAYLEAQVILSAVMRRYDIQVAPGYKPAWVVSITLSPRGGIPVTISRRMKEEG
jgi:cytochrome P450